jgi:hypothetical protein
MAAFAGPAIAALIMTGAGPANAAVTTTTAPTASTWQPYYPYCSQWNLERYDFRGDNTVQLHLNGTTYDYAVHFNQQGSCLSGWLKDTYIPNNYNEYLPLHGTVFRNHVTFSVTYTYPGEIQGTRTFTGTIGYWGWVSGTWSETGSEGGSGNWSLQNAVRLACPNWYPWFGFFQYGNGCPVPFPYGFYY